MKTFPFPYLAVLLQIGLVWSVQGAAPPTPVLSITNAALSGARAGDSSQPIITPDGRYVIFTSQADNLESNALDRIPLQSIAKLNVYRHDRLHGTTVLVSVRLDGRHAGNKDSWAAGISTNGQFVLFESQASDLIADDTNNAPDVFLADLVKGVTVCVSRNSDDALGNGTSCDAVMTPDAQYIAFTSFATNLIAGDTNGLSDVFRRDLQTGELSLVSAGATRPTSSRSSGSGQPRLTPDGRFVVFLSSANGLVPAVSNTFEIYVRDIQTGQMFCPSFYRFKKHDYGYNHQISDDGRYVAYQAAPANTERSTLFRYDLIGSTSNVIGAALFTAVANQIGFRYDQSVDMSPDGRFITFLARKAVGGVAGPDVHVYRWDSQTGVTVPVSVGLDGSESAGALSSWPKMSTDGRYITFYSTATGLVTNQVSPGFHLYERDMIENNTWLIDAGPTGAASDKNILNPAAMSADGRYVAFDSTDADLVIGDTNNAIDVFMRDTVSQTTECLSRAYDQTISATVAEMNLGSLYSTSHDGSRVAFTAAQSAFFGGTNNYRHAFVRDLITGMNLLASPNTAGVADALRNCMSPSISADGRKVVFSTVATNLLTSDTNSFEDVYFRDLETAQTLLVSVALDGTSQSNGHSTSPTISQNGRYVLFWTRASNLTATSAALLLRDLQAGTNYALGNASVARGAMTPDGQFVAFSTSSGTLNVWSTAQQTPIFTTNSVLLRSLAISPDGNRIAGLTSTGVFLVNRARDTTQWLGSASSAILPMNCTAQFSASGNRLVFALPASLSDADTNALPDVYLYDYSDETTTLISRPATGDPVGNGRSDSAALSPDGRYVAFRSTADNLVIGDTNGVPDVFLYDTQTREMVRVSAGYGSGPDANDRSLAPAFSGDGQTLFFLSAASNIATNDLNRALDLLSLRIAGGSPAPLFVGQILYQPANSAAPVIVWPAAEGKTYHVEYKNELSDPAWTTLVTWIHINGSEGSATDPTPHLEHRFYRIVAH